MAAALMVDTPRVETFSVVEPRFAVPETVKLATVRAWELRTRLAVVRVLATVKLVVVRVLPTTRSDVTLAVEALSWPWTTTLPEAVKGEEPVTEKREHETLVALSWPWTTSDDAILTLEANVAEPDTLSAPVALTRPDETKDEVFNCDAVNWPVILVGPWIVVAVKSGVVILP